MNRPFSSATLKALDESVIGRSRESEIVVATLMAGRHLLLEGPPGTGKSTLLRAVAHHSDVGFHFCEGNAELTPARLVGHFDPAQVLDRGYTAEIWVDGPLTRALRQGELLYLEEINRIPEETLNLLVTVMSEGELTIPRLGTLHAHPGFRFVAAMNPFDAVGTARISGAIADRMCRLAMDYQSEADESAIATFGTNDMSGSTEPSYVDQVVRLVRATRDHRDLRVGSSVRGAIDMLRLISSLGELRSLPPTDRDVALDAALCALTGRVRVRDACNRTPEEIITELFDVHLPDGDVPDEELKAGKARSRPTAA